MSARRRFGDFELDPADRLLSRGGRRVALQDKPMEALLLLTERAGALVERDELRQALWPGQRFGAFEHGLDVVLDKLRRALGESARRPRWIETVRGRGYRFAGPSPDGPTATGRVPGAPAVRAGAAHPHSPVGEAEERMGPAGVHPLACAAFLRARFEMSRRTRAGLRRAQTALTEALALSPGYARAHAALAGAHAIAVDYGAGGDEQAPAAVRSAYAALRLDPSLAEARAVLGFVRHRLEWDWEGAEAEYRRALALEPGLAVGRQWLAELLSQTGRAEEALAEAQLAAQLDPLSPIARSVCAWVALHARRFEEALATCREVTERHPGFPVARFVASRALRALGRSADAVAEAESAAALSDGDPWAVAGLASALAQAGRSARARALLAGLAAPGDGERPASPYLLASVDAALGDADAALTRLEQAHRTRASWLADLAVDPGLDALRRRPRYETLRSALRLPPAAA